MENKEKNMENKEKLYKYLIDCIKEKYGINVTVSYVESPIEKGKTKYGYFIERGDKWTQTAYHSIDDLDKCMQYVFDEVASFL